jgi:hypothetical protein
MCLHSCFLQPSLFIYKSGRDSPPPASALRELHPLCYVSLLLLILITQFLFFSLGGHRSVQRAMLLWPVCRLTHLVVRVFPSHLGAGIWLTGALLVSSFNVKWRCSVQAGGVEGSKFCFFSVVFPVRCISRISARFYFRRHAFCFLPLAAIFLISFLTLCCVGEGRG